MTTKLNLIHEPTVDDNLEPSTGFGTPLFVLGLVLGAWIAYGVFLLRGTAPASISIREVAAPCYAFPELSEPLGASRL